MNEVFTSRVQSRAERAWLTACGVDRNAATITLRLPIYDDDGVAVGEGTLTATIDDVLATRACLAALQSEYPMLFRRAATLASENTVPADRLRILAMPQYGQLTDEQTGEWLENRRQLLLALVKIEIDKPTFVDNPFA